MFAIVVLYAGGGLVRREVNPDQLNAELIGFTQSEWSVGDAVTFTRIS